MATLRRAPSSGRSRRTVGLTAGLLLVLVLGPAARQDPPPRQGPPSQPAVTFRVETNYIEVDAIVTDERGAFVRDLGADEFELLENGSAQEIAVFSMIDIPLERDDRPLHRETRIEPDVATNEHEAAEGRVYLLVLDSRHVDAARSFKVKDLARQFLNRYLAANDLAAVVLLGQGESQEFTANRSLLLSAVDRFMGSKLPSPFVAAATRNPTSSQERAAVALHMLSSLRSLSEYLAGLRGRRKALVLFSEGVDIDVHNIVGSSDDSISDATMTPLADALLEEEREMFRAVTRSNVSIYSVDPRGATSGADEVIRIMTGPGELSPVRALDTELMRSQGMLRAFADQTGGLAAVGSGDFARAFRRIVADNSAYYQLGYRPSNPAQDGKYRRISVRVKRPGLRVRARPGYFARRPSDALPAVAAPAAASEELQALLASPTQIRGLPMRVAADAFRGASPKALVHLIVEFAGSGLPLREQDAAFTNSVELLVRANDSRGDLQADARRSLDLRLRPETKQAIERNGLRFTTEFEVPPGRYQIRVAGRETERGRTGSVFVDLEIPDFTRGQLVMSDLLLTASSAAGWPTRGDAAATLRPLLPGIPTAAREFSSADTLGVFTEIYDNEPRPHRVDIVMTVRADDGTTALTAREQRDRSEIGGTGRGGYGYAARMPLAGLAPGRYVLTIEARSRLDDTRTTKDVEFRVR
jgi:VWFA-related protein